MYFPGDPLFEQDPIFQSVRDEKARQRMISTFDLETTQPEWALGYRFDIVLEGREATPMENHT
jgi:protocatechuate 3,4-dioxygenase beta subunit